MNHRPSEPTFAEVLSQAVGERNLTLDRLSTRLSQLGTPTSIATLSYWQTGRSVPTRARSLKAVEHLERILDVPTGHLVRSLPGDLLNRWDPQAAVTSGPDMMEALDALGLDLNRHSTNQTLQVTYFISEDRLRLTERIRQLARADEDGWNRFAVVLDVGEDHRVPEPEAGPGCRIGEQVRLKGGRQVVVEVLLPRRLSQGDLVGFEYCIHWSSDIRPFREHTRAMASGVRFLVIDAHLAGKPASRARFFQAVSIDAPEEDDAVEELLAGNHLQKAVRNAPAGLYGLGWDY